MPKKTTEGHFLTVDLVQRGGDRRRISYNLPMTMQRQDWTALENDLDNFVWTVERRMTNELKERDHQESMPFIETEEFPT